MSINLDDEITQDFLLEAGEILEQLNEQLVDMETNPEDMDLLNAVFRGFHTIKGGAGFLAIEALVDVCHIAENVFDVLRNGERQVDADLMDSVLQCLDVVNAMFEDIQEGNTPSAADMNLIENLKRLSVPAANDETPAPVELEVVVDNSVQETPQEVIEEEKEIAETSSEVNTPSETESEDITDEEFQNLLDELHGDGAPGVTKSNTVEAASNNDDITEEEFEAVLDDLQSKGEGAFAKVPKAQSEPAQDKSASDDITEEEFEAVLDDLQSKGQGAFAKTPEPPKSANDENTEVKAEPVKAVVPPAKQDKPAPAKSKPATADKKAKPAASKADNTVRVETNVLDNIMNMVGELVLIRNRLSNLDEEIGHDGMSQTVSNLDVVTADLQSLVMKTRMQPIKKVFGRFPRLVRDLARSLDKQIKLTLIGEETDLDKNLVEALSDPLIHLVRNSIDHGVEMPDTRVANDKPAEGEIILSASQEGDHILLQIQDDGAGINADVLKNKVVEKGLMDQDAADRLTEKECYNLIFMPGFSTKQEISDISGRGVGMDVVKTKISQLNGVIDIDSTLGEGTKILIKVPLTLAIMPTLMVNIGKQEQIFALPLVNVDEILDIDENKLSEIDGRQVMIVRDKPLPLFHLSKWLGNGFANEQDDAEHIVVVTIGTQKYGLLVDQLMGREEVVIKPLGAMLHGTKGVSGATITGNGKIALIIDLPSLIQAYANYL